MRFSISLSVALLLLYPFAQAQEKKEPNPNLVNIHKLFIKGNNEAATVARKILIERAKNDKANSAPLCFELMGNEKAADATLELSQEVTGDSSAATVSATLSDKDGNLLWSDSKEGKRSTITFGGFAPLTAAESGTAKLLSGLMKETCEAGPTIELNKVRKIQVIGKKGTWKSDCLTFVEKYGEADALLLTEIGGGNLIWVLSDPKNQERIPGWSSDSFPDVKKLEEAVSCHTNVAKEPGGT
jgi:hypothetical protein